MVFMHFFFSLVSDPEPKPEPIPVYLETENNLKPIKSIIDYLPIFGKSKHN